MEDDRSIVNNHHHTSPALTTAHSLTTNTTNKRRHEEGSVGGEADSYDGDSEVWNAFKSNFQEVQSVLDRNRVLIQQVNANHQSRVHDNLVENVSLIREINGNISKVVSLYSDLSTNFSGAFNQHKDTATKGQSNPDKAEC